MILIVKYDETKSKKDKLWDSLIKWCKDHEAFIGEAIQSDDFVIDAPEFIAKTIDEIIGFESEWK